MTETLSPVLRDATAFTAHLAAELEAKPEELTPRMIDVLVQLAVLQGALGTAEALLLQERRKSARLEEELAALREVPRIPAADVRAALNAERQAMRSITDPGDGNQEALP